MNETVRQRWVGGVVLVGLAYALVGVAFAWPTTHVKAWRLAAWLVSAALYVAHVAYETLRLRHAPPRAALDVALAVALGAFGLAVGANIHSLAVVSSSQHRQLLRIALVVWPIITALPAFVVALAASAVLRRIWLSAQGK